jgi:hypothetical protein
MTLWELLATTDHRVMSWQESEWPCWPQGTRQIYWQDGDGLHRATAVFDGDYEIMALELIESEDQSLRWLDDNHTKAFRDYLKAQGHRDTAQPVALDRLYPLFLETLK